MLRIPESLLKKSAAICGKEGIAWGLALPETIRSCCEKWRIDEIALAENLSYNMVLMAHSQDFGDCVVKIHLPGEAFTYEAKALSLYAGKPICRLYDVYTEQNALCLERAETSLDLRTEADFYRRLEIGVALISSMPMALSAEQAAWFPSYRQWLDKAFVRVRKENRGGPPLLRCVERAETLLPGLKGICGHSLIHGDLHHGNILKHKEGYRVIDPHGVTGAPLIEAARFIENEMALYPRSDKEKAEAVCSMVKAFASAFGASCTETLYSLFVDSTLSACWSAEESAPEEEIEGAMKELLFLEGLL